MYDDGDADEAMAFHKYVIISKEGQLDAVKVLEHNLDDNDIIPGKRVVDAAASKYSSTQKGLILRMYDV